MFTCIHLPSKHVLRVKRRLLLSIDMYAMRGLAAGNQDYLFLGKSRESIFVQVVKESDVEAVHKDKGFAGCFLTSAKGRSIYVKIKIGFCTCAKYHSRLPATEVW